MSWSNGVATRFPPIDRVARLTVAVDHVTQLLLCARDGDHAALERFIAETQRDVWRMCRYLGDPDTADDLAQETYERAIGSLHRYRADGPARHWILTIARRVCVDSTRRRRRGRRLQRRLADEPTTLSMPSEVAELDDLLAQLDHDRRAAFVTTQVLGLRYDEAADLLDCPIGTIRSRVARARADLVGFLDEPGAIEATG
jgi:RNA polymerase sigma-70 factor (ECF subfamily)